MNKRKELVKNTIILFIGKFCTQFISFFLIPIYTRYLVTSDYGYVDLVQTYISLLVPIIILRFDSAIFRFLIDERNNKENKIKVISSTFAILFMQIIVFVILFGVIQIKIDIIYGIYITINIIFMALSSISLQLTRGIGDSIAYAIGSALCGISTVLLNFIFIVVLKKDASSILIATGMGNIICVIFLFFKNKLYRYLKLSKIDRNYLKKMLKYSLPMIPDGLSWWIVNVSDRTIISFFKSVALNGIYAISCKFSNILSTFFQIFNMTWQESASLHINEDDKDDFFSNIFNSTLRIFSSICLLLMVCMPFVYMIMVGDEYKISYIYIPTLLLGNLFNSTANVIGAVYIAKKNTKRVASTTVLAAILNILINIIFIKKFELWAAVFSTLISYIILTIYRLKDVKKYVVFNIDVKIVIILSCVYMISSVLYYINNLLLNIINVIFILTVSIIVNRNFLKSSLEVVRNKFIKGN